MIKIFGRYILSSREWNQIVVNEGHWQTCWNRLLALEVSMKRLTYERNSDYNNLLDLWKRIDDLTGEDRYGRKKPKESAE